VQQARAMSAHGITEVVYCNHCGTENPPRSAVCCNCGHVHALERPMPPEPPRAMPIERWAWIVLRIICGITLCVGRVVPTGGTPLNAALLGRIVGSLAIPIAIGAVVGGGNLAKSSRWFLWSALLLPILHYAGALLSRIHLR
jgi:hypothetical protein